MLTPFVKPCQVLGYLDVAIVKNLRNLHKIACKFRDFFVSETRKNWLREYLVSVSRGAPFSSSYLSVEYQCT